MSDLQADIRKVAAMMVDVARRMDAGNPGNLEDVRDVTWHMRRIAVLLFGYAPQPTLPSPAEYRSALFTSPLPAPIPHSSLRTRILDVNSAETVADKLALLSSGSVK